MLGEQVAVLSNILVIKISDPEIQENTQQKGEVEQGKIFAV